MDFGGDPNAMDDPNAGGGGGDEENNHGNDGGGGGGGGDEEHNHGNDGGGNDGGGNDGGGDDGGGNDGGGSISQLNDITDDTLLLIQSNFHNDSTSGITLKDAVSHNDDSKLDITSTNIVEQLITNTSIVKFGSNSLWNASYRKGTFDDIGTQIGTNDFTIEFYFTPTSSLNGYPQILCFDNQSTGMALKITPHSSNSFYMHDGDVRNNVTNKRWNVGIWYHIAYERENGTHRVYIDGIKQENEVSFSNKNLSSKPLYIGGGYTKESTDNNRLWEWDDFCLDCIRITKKARYNGYNFVPQDTASPWIGNGPSISAFNNSKFELGTNKNFSNYNLKQKDFTDMNLSGAIFTNADLSGANLTGADLTNADLTNTDLTNITWTNATFTNVILESITLSLDLKTYFDNNNINYTVPNDITNDTLLLVQSNFSTANVPKDSTDINDTINIIGGDGSTITHNTGNAKFGYASLQFSGSKFLSISPPSNNLNIWDFGGGSDIDNKSSFTIEFWVDMTGCYWNSLS